MGQVLGSAQLTCIRCPLIASKHFLLSNETEGREANRPIRGLNPQSLIGDGFLTRGFT